MRLLFMLLGNVCIPAMVAYLVGRNKRFRQYILAPLTLRSAIVFTVVCGLLAIVSSYYGTRIHGALASTRIVGVLIGGIIGGPWVGLATGSIGGLHRYSLGGFTAASCGIATVLAGILAGLVRFRCPFTHMNWKIAAAIALAAEVLQKSLTLLLAKPFEQALAFERTAALPTTAVTIIGTVLFVLILQDMQKQYEAAGAAAVEQELASRRQAVEEKYALPLFTLRLKREGLHLKPDEEKAVRDDLNRVLLERDRERQAVDAEKQRLVAERIRPERQAMQERLLAYARELRAGMEGSLDKLAREDKARFQQGPESFQVLLGSVDRELDKRQQAIETLEADMKSDVAGIVTKLAREKGYTVVFYKYKANISADDITQPVLRDLQQLASKRKLADGLRRRTAPTAAAQGTSK